MANAETKPPPRELRRADRGFASIGIVREVALILLLSGIGLAAFVAFSCVRSLQRAREDDARADARDIRHAVISYRAERWAAGCPTMHALIEKDPIHRYHPGDPWGNGFGIECAGDDVTVISAGRDELLGTDDDLFSDDEP